MTVVSYCAMMNLGILTVLIALNGS